MSHLIFDNFFNKSDQLRQFFDQQFANPLEAHENRFVWDYWNVPDQYNLLRTPAYHYFPQDLYAEWEQALIRFGQQELGCQNISPPWLSCYIDGCEQRLHADSPHGPWAFVYSLTLWDARTFSGGETVLLRPEILNYWNHRNFQQGLEEPHILTTIEPKFNRLTIFDPRCPHGVREVRGTKDPRQARLVIHGWFTEPQPVCIGPLNEEEVHVTLSDILTTSLEQGLPADDLNGVLIFKLTINEDGSVDVSETPTRNIHGAADPTQIADWIRQLRESLGQARFQTADAKTSVTLPIIFESDA